MPYEQFRPRYTAVCNPLAAYLDDFRIRLVYRCFLRIAKVSQGTVLLIRLIIRLLLYNQSAECLLALRLLGAEINVGTYLS